MSAAAQALRLHLDSGATVSGLLLGPAHPAGCFVFAHGAGAGMHHPFMENMAEALCRRGIATLRFQFPFMEAGRKRPDRPAVAQEAVRAAVAEAARRCRGMPILAGGKSFGGRMSSQAQAAQPLADAAGLVFLGFPLHPAGQPATERADHLDHVNLPMLFLQGDRDKLADIERMKGKLAQLGPAATLHVIAGADHGFEVLARSGRSEGDVIEELAGVVAGWVVVLGQGAAPAG